jgi:hypothetical protein
MTTLPLMDCSKMLAIDAKTLRQWLRQANIPLHPHPTDARVKCLTIEQVRSLAALHGRMLQPHEALTTPLLGAPLRPTDTAAALVEIPVPQPETDLLTKLAYLETQVTTMQQHLTGLALELLQERTLRFEQRLHTLEVLIPPPRQQAMSASSLQTAKEHGSQMEKPLTAPRVHAAKGRARAILPLIEYGADGTYIVICPQRGELELLPDSPEWFAWLETVSSLRFLGQQGRWSAYRDKERTSCCWFAYRRIHGHQYVRALGSPHQLTIARFEQMAATLQSYVPPS